MLCFAFMLYYIIWYHIIEHQIRTGPIVLTPVGHFQVPYTVIVKLIGIVSISTLISIVIVTVIVIIVKW